MKKRIVDERGRWLADEVDHVWPGPEAPVGVSPIRHPELTLHRATSMTTRSRR